MLQYVPRIEQQVACFCLAKDGVNFKSAYQVVGTQWDNVLVVGTQPWRTRWKLLNLYELYHN